jgi:hypothetical protein
MSRKRSLDNEKRREARKNKVESPEIERKRLSLNEKPMQARNNVVESEEIKRKRSYDNAKSRVARLNIVETPEMRVQRTVDNARRRNLNKKQVKNSDCGNYAREYDEKSRFIACAICGIEGSQTGSVLLADNEDIVIKSGIREEFESYVKTSDESTNYDKIFIEELKSHFDCGLISGLKSICVLCSSEMKRKKSDINDSSSRNIPKMVYFKGLFAGSIPMELSNLTAVEDSMINIYSAISKVCLAGGKHYKMNTGTCYTVVNDLASVARKLPRMPTIDTIAILRHKNAKVSKDYTYRPYKIFTALTWLKKNNHLYESIELEWPKEVLDWQNMNTVVEPPYIELTDEEEPEINEENDVFDDKPSTNPGTINRTSFHYVLSNSKCYF